MTTSACPSCPFRTVCIIDSTLSGLVPKRPVQLVFAMGQELSAVKVIAYELPTISRMSLLATASASPLSYVCHCMPAIVESPSSVTFVRSSDAAYAVGAAVRDACDKAPAMSAPAVARRRVRGHEKGIPLI